MYLVEVCDTCNVWRVWLFKCLGRVGCYSIMLDACDVEAGLSTLAMLFGVEVSTLLCCQAWLPVWFYVPGKGRVLVLLFRYSWEVGVL